VGCIVEDGGNTWTLRIEHWQLEIETLQIKMSNLE